MAIRILILIVAITPLGCGGEDYNCSDEEERRVNYKSCVGEEQHDQEIVDRILELDDLERDPEPDEVYQCDGHNSEDVAFKCNASEGQIPCEWTVEPYQGIDGAKPTHYCSCEEYEKLDDFHKECH